MLPFDNRPWAKTVARTVIALSFIFAIAGAYYLYTLDELHIAEVTGILLLLLTIVPPNVAIVLRKSESNANPLSQATLHTR
jgi:uncharacterized membrane protein